MNTFIVSILSGFLSICNFYKSLTTTFLLSADIQAIKITSAVIVVYLEVINLANSILISLFLQNFTLLKYLIRYNRDSKMGLLAQTTTFTTFVARQRSR